MKSIIEILRRVALRVATLVVTTGFVLAGQPPAATTSQVTNLTPINATLRGLVWPYGAETVAWFEWGSSTNYGNRIGMTNAGSAAWDGILIEATLSNLVASTKYHYRVAASNVWGKTYGANLVFTAPLFAEVGADLRVDQGSGGRRDVAGGTAAWGDYNLDGTLDVLLTGNYTSDGGYYGTIFRNEGNGTFASVLARSLLSGVTSAAWGDWNNDGNLDILAPALRGICINNGLGGFGTVSLPDLYRLYSVSSTPSITWGDYNSDGRLDLLVTGMENSSYVSRIYRNHGDGTFTDIGASLPGLRDASAVWGDYDNDGFLDILLTGYERRDAYTWRTTSRIYRNNEDGTFSEIKAGLLGVACKAGGVVWGDYNNDGYLDILLAGWYSGDLKASNAFRVYRNNGDATFTDINANLPQSVDAVALGDCDNDGDMDILASLPEGTRVYRHDGNNTFTDIEAGLAGGSSSSFAWGDYDNDGKLDVLLSGRDRAGYAHSRLYRNFAPVANTPPSPPTGLTALRVGTNVVFQWSEATDRETPASGLTYNLRIGTTPGGCDVISPAAASSGFRLLPARGNAGHRLSFTAAISTDRTYYWSVQAVDSAFAGSAFASEVVVVLPGFPLASTLPASDVRLDGFTPRATLNGLVNPHSAATLAYFEWGLTTNYANMTIVTNLAGGTNDVPLNLALTNLNGNTTYCFRMVASNSFGKVFGTNHVFTTPIPPPYASTLPATLITGNGAVLNARVNPNGTSTEVWFEFGTQTGYYPFGSFGNTNIGSGSSELLIGASIPTWRPLQPATLYHYRVGARNSGGTTYGADASFTTTGSQPLAAVQYPSLVTVSNALFNGAVNPNGETTAAWYEWGITTNYGRFVTIPYSNGRFTNLWFEGSAPVNYDRITPPKAVGSGTSYASAGSMVNDLTPGTMYEYRLVASNRFGQVTNGYAWCPVPAPQVVVEPATAVTGSSAILHAQVNPNGWPVTAWFQWGLNGIENRSAPIYLSPRTNPVPLSLYVTGLVSGVTYGYYQVMVTNGAFNTFGGWSFTTPIPPTVTTLSATAVSHTNATLKGSVNPKSLPTRAWFEWGLSTNYAHRTSSVEVGAGNTNVPVAMAIGPLSSLATYHFRFVAESPGGVVHGPDATFTTLPPPVASDGYYVSRTLLPEGLSTPITITTTGGNHFYQGAIPRPFRIRLTQNGQPFNLIEPESVWPQSLTFMFPPLDPGYYGFVIQTQYPLSGWGDYYESGPRFFKVERYVAAQVGTPHSFQLAARNSTMEQVNPTEFIPTATYTLSNVITGTIAVRQHVNAGLNMPWLADIWKSGENGVKLSFDFILDDYVMFKFGIPIVITFDFPTIVAQGQLVEAKAPSVSYPGGEWLRAEHNVYYSTDHNLWLNAPFDGLPPVDISLSQKDDKLLIWGSVPTLPGCDAISFSVDSSAVPWILTPVGEGALGNQDPFGDGEAEFGGVKNRLGGNVSWVNSGETLESVNEWREIWTGDWTRNPGLWYSGGDQILFLAGSSIPYVSQAAQLLTLFRVKLFSFFDLHVMSRDQISLAPFDFYLSTKIPWNAPTNYVIQGTFTNPVQFDLASHYMYRLGAGFELDMPIIGRQSLGSWNGNDIYQSGPLWSPTYESNLVFTVKLPVTVLPTNAFKQKYLELATADNAALERLSNFTLPEALEDKLRIAELVAKMRQGNLQPLPADSMISMGTFLPQPESAFALLLSSDSSIGGTILADPPPVDGGYAAGTVVRLAASSGPGYKFTGWGGDAAGSANPVTVTMNDVKQVTARFETALPPVALVNPSFELDTFTKWPGYRDANGPITGWTTEAGMGLNPVAPYGTNDYPFADYGAIPHGRQAAFLQGEGALKQMVKRLTAGSQYRVEYRENARRAGYGGMITKDAPILEVRMGTNVIDAAHEVRPLSLYAQKASQPFVANGPEMELAFVKTGPVGLDRTVLIDEVRVICLTLPAQLSATLEKGSLILSWDPALSGSILETTESLLPPIQWTPVPGAANGPITVPVQGAARFYRLRQ